MTKLYAMLLLALMVSATTSHARSFGGSKSEGALLGSGTKGGYSAPPSPAHDSFDPDKEKELHTVMFLV